MKREDNVPEVTTRRTPFPLPGLVVLSDLGKKTAPFKRPSETLRTSELDFSEGR